MYKYIRVYKFKYEYIAPHNKRHKGSATYLSTISTQVVVVVVLVVAVVKLFA